MNDTPAGYDHVEENKNPRQIHRLHRTHM